jgi:rRNA maturation protein Nop10
MNVAAGKDQAIPKPKRYSIKDIYDQQMQTLTQPADVLHSNTTLYNG